jgi:steroid delta-isomerase
LTCLLAAFALPAAAEQATPDAEIRAALSQWTADFNAGHAEKVCDLFAPSLRADVRGAPERNFDSQCDLLRAALANPERNYTYALEVDEILPEGDMAVVRLVSTSTVKIKATGQTVTTADQGMAVFGKRSDGPWRIIRLMAYERP